MYQIIEKREDVLVIWTYDDTYFKQTKIVTKDFSGISGVYLLPSFFLSSVVYLQHYIEIELQTHSH